MGITYAAYHMPCKQGRLLESNFGLQDRSISQTANSNLLDIQWMVNTLTQDRLLRPKTVHFTLDLGLLKIENKFFGHKKTKF